MSLADELQRLSDLHQRGQISDAEFAAAKARLLHSESSPARQINGLRRSREDRWLGGVCGGLAETTGIDSWIWRMAFVLFFVCAGTGGLAYLLLWIFVPDE